jgi:hypothetical protein
MVVQGEKKRRLKSIAKLMYCVCNFPQLYIYSTSDHIIPHNAIKAWIQVRNGFDLFLARKGLLCREAPTPHPLITQKV